jgi:hypothetical protein
MGVDYKAYYAVIGCILDRSKIAVKQEKVKTFKHDYPEDGETKFDPKTGIPLWKTIEYPEYIFDAYDCEGRAKVIKLNGLNIFISGGGNTPEVIGIGTGRKTYSNGGEAYDFRPLVEDLDSIKKRIKDVLEPIGMWDETSFGLYSILYCSY